MVDWTDPHPPPAGAREGSALPPPPLAEDELVAIPRLAEHTGVTPRVLRYWEELGLISPTREHGRLRYSPRDTAIARLTKRLVDSGVSLDGLRMLKELSEREVRRGAEGPDRRALTELALRILYQRKAFREVTGTDEEHYPDSPPAPPHHGPPRPEPPRHGRGPKGHGPGPAPPSPRW